MCIRDRPIIDIMAVVRSLEIVDTVAEKFSDIGYEYLGEFGIEGRRSLRKGCLLYTSRCV